MCQKLTVTFVVVLVWFAFSNTVPALAQNHAIAGKCGDALRGRATVCNPTPATREIFNNDDYQLTVSCEAWKSDVVANCPAAIASQPISGFFAPIAGNCGAALRTRSAICDPTPGTRESLSKQGLLSALPELCASAESKVKAICPKALGGDSGWIAQKGAPGGACGDALNWRQLVCDPTPEQKDTFPVLRNEVTRGPFCADAKIKANEACPPAFVQAGMSSSPPEGSRALVAGNCGLSLSMRNATCNPTPEARKMFLENALGSKDLAKWCDLASEDVQKYCPRALRSDQTETKRVIKRKAKSAKAKSRKLPPSPCREGEVCTTKAKAKSNLDNFGLGPNFVDGQSPQVAGSSRNRASSKTGSGGGSTITVSPTGVMDTTSGGTSFRNQQHMINTPKTQIK